ncbi:g12423 [Coccomyxa viridis]|uniref:G12423 protein n=1 Tax=Coccomyxa viridis TaxID=1274662 RepID=A0ABP1GEY0_9CHLO
MFGGKEEDAGPSSSGKYAQYRDIESQEELLVPGMSKTDNMLRWGFIRKVYGIVSAQLILTAIVAGIIYAVPPVRGFVTTSLAFQLTFAILPLVGLIPLFIYARQHPTNIILLAAWTACMAVGLGTACTVYEPAIVLEALCLTAAIVVGLTLYTFYAVRKGVSFQRLGPILFCALCGLVMWSFLQLVLGSYLGPASRTVFALLGALVFSAYIVLDTENLIAKHDLDDYVAASLSLYLDIINLFLTLLRLLGNNRN